MSKNAPKRRTVIYPDSDGKPLAEGDYHWGAMMVAINSAKEHFKNDPNAYITGNLLLYYVMGDPKKRVAPDWFFARAPKRDRNNYLLWEEPQGPGAVLEITSIKSKREDLETKFALYRDVLKVPECFLFDPLEDHLVPSLQGHRLIEGQYVPIPPIDGLVPSEQLGLHLFREGHHVRFCVVEPGRVLLTPRERAQVEAERARKAEALVASQAELLRAKDDRIQALLLALEEAHRRQGGAP